MYHVYVLWSQKSDKRYVGSTGKTSIERLQEHNAGASKFTKGNRPWILLHDEKYVTVAEAKKRENFLKSGAGRKFLDEFLKNREYPLPPP